jgi:hypothetical protein
MKSAIANYEKALDAKKAINVNSYKVQVRSPDITEILKICNGHNDYTKEYWRGDAESKVVRLRNQFSNHKDFKSYNAYRSSSGSGLFEDYRVYESWSHIDNCQHCNNFREERKVISGTYSWQVTQESYRNYNSAIDLANKRIESLEKEARHQIQLKEQSNQELKEAISLLQNYDEVGGTRNIRLEKLINSQDQVYKELLSSVVEINKTLLDEIKNLSLQERSHLLLNAFISNDPQIDLIERYILQMGCDIDYFACIAFDQDNIGLFKYALMYGANPIRYSKDSKTLLQQIIHTKKDQYIDLIINDKSVEDLGTTILSAIKENDLVTINRLITHKSDIFLSKLLGINLIDFVIYTKNEELFDKILSLHPEIFKLIDPQLLCNTALKYGTDHIVLKILEYSSLSIKDYAELLLLTEEIGLLENLDKICDAYNIERYTQKISDSKVDYYANSCLITSELGIDYSSYYETDSLLNDEGFL